MEEAIRRAAVAIARTGAVEAAGMVEDTLEAVVPCPDLDLEAGRDNNPVGAWDTAHIEHKQAACALAVASA